eukprot:TRINITY_DN20993_c0_g1_i1.p1 TRINITY_DN20993_c0_g1~~TRINITY_DN20993_c0_g1_i1.p1  ORF type:complete len:290 (-),score=50.87 TRINITY_DN20993_c0_g1_i1:471-1340(-)
MHLWLCVLVASTAEPAWVFPDARLGSKALQTELPGDLPTTNTIFVESSNAEPRSKACASFVLMFAALIVIAAGLGAARWALLQETRKEPTTDDHSSLKSEACMDEDCKPRSCEVLVDTECEGGHEGVSNQSPTAEAGVSSCIASSSNSRSCEMIQEAEREGGYKDISNLSPTAEADVSSCVTSCIHNTTNQAGGHEDNSNLLATAKAAVSSCGASLIRSIPEQAPPNFDISTDDSPCHTPQQTTPTNVSGCDKKRARPSLSTWWNDHDNPMDITRVPSPQKSPPVALQA